MIESFMAKIGEEASVDSYGEQWAFYIMLFYGDLFFDIGNIPFLVDVSPSMF